MVILDTLLVYIFVNLTLKESVPHQPRTSPHVTAPIPAKCLERLVMKYIRGITPASFDQHQFASKANRSTEDAVALLLHTALEHLELKNTYIRILFLDYSLHHSSNLTIRLAPHKVACLAHYYTLSTPMTVLPPAHPTTSLNLQMTQQCLASSPTTMRLPTGKK